MEGEVLINAPVYPHCSASFVQKRFIVIAGMILAYSVTEEPLKRTDMISLVCTMAGVEGGEGICC